MNIGKEEDPVDLPMPVVPEEVPDLVPEPHVPVEQPEPEKVA